VFSILPVSLIEQGHQPSGCLASPQVAGPGPTTGTRCCERLVVKGRGSSVSRHHFALTLCGPVTKATAVLLAKRGQSLLEVAPTGNMLRRDRLDEFLG
jgi:hypothetical protein